MPLPSEDILSFWFGAWPFDAAKAEQQKDKWFVSTPSMDQELTNKFGHHIESALNRPEKPRSLEDKIAYILLLDQFTRNVYRGTGQAFSGDRKSLDVCLELIESKAYQTLPMQVAVFACMPLQHSEDSKIQDLSIETFCDLVRIHGEAAEGFLKFARMHKDIIDQFSRYPHRNDVLNRTSTPEEVQYLENAQRFGQ